MIRIATAASVLALSVTPVFAHEGAPHVHMETFAGDVVTSLTAALGVVGGLCALGVYVLRQRLIKTRREVVSVAKRGR